MPKKLLKADYVNIIQEHFAKEGKRMANISKATIPKLKELIEKYNIKYDEKEIIEENEKQKKELKEEEEKEEKERKERNRKWKEEEDRKEEEWNNLTEEEKDNVLTFICIKYQKEYLDNYWKNKKHNKDLKEECDKIEEKFKSEGANVERIGINHLIINGVNLIHDVVIEPFDWNDTYERAKKSYKCYEPLKILEEIKVSKITDFRYKVQ